MKLNKVKGTKDYFGIESKKLFFIKKTLSDLACKFNYTAIKFPTFEYLEVYKRTLGDETDIVNKEMYSFEDKKGRTIVLRPEGTASTARLVLENKLIELNQKQKLFYIENMFRYERPQKGRQREFIQFGVENLNAELYSDDVEIIQFALEVIKSLNISNYELNINYIGSKETRDKYSQELKKFLKKDFDRLSEDSKIRLENNVLRILDSKDNDDNEIIKNAPSIIDFLNSEETKNYKKIKESLSKLKIKFCENKKLVRGLDYYNGLVFEVISLDKEKLGAQSTLIGGGRYDKLITQFDKTKATPSVGFAAGIERLMLVSEEWILKNISNSFDYAIITTSPEFSDLALEVASIIRKRNSVETYLKETSLKKKIIRAEKDGALNIIIISENTVLNNEIEVKNLNEQKLTKIKIESIGKKLWKNTQ